MQRDEPATDAFPEPYAEQPAVTPGRCGTARPATGADPNPGMLLFLLFTIYRVLDEFEDGIVIVDEANRVRWVNASIRHLFDLGESDVAGMPAGTFTQRFIVPLTGGPGTAAGNRELHLRKPGGEECWLECTSHPMRLYPLCNNRLEIYRKITRWKLAERHLGESEERYRTLFEKGNDAILVFELSPESVPTRFVEANEVACRRLGYTRDELLVRSPLDIVPPERLGSVLAILKQFRLNDRILYESEHVAKDGSRVPVEINSLHFPLQGKTTVLSISRDISERRKIEEVRRKAFDQIERNIEQFATLGDQVRQPLQVIAGLAGMDDSKYSAEIATQAAAIDALIDRLDQGWIESEKVRRFLRRHY
ncbi:PAS domain S-box protein [Methanoculleus sp. Wushi-C6]|uniref:PAS domain S-box protein n=1 Tax=Methanoculleus caldifontis TaxID=2651577 RepID=A0ABU3X1D9_9EURY|nr:PAS domain S-box protein [Methanoculleus sp. Wushi-C6]MDV2481860.1 PAS domain S-box protein [Methanoculleus sp. Wushi-C6]